MREKGKGKWMGGESDGEGVIRNREMGMKSLKGKEREREQKGGKERRDGRKRKKNNTVQRK